MTPRDEIGNLIALYAEALDGGDFPGLGELFRRGKVAIEGGPHSGRSAGGASEVEALYREIVVLDETTGTTGTRHFITNLFTEFVDDARCSARSYFQVTQQTPTLPLQVVACGAYHDEFVRDGDRWAYSARRIVCDQVGELSEHMR